MRGRARTASMPNLKPPAATGRKNPVVRNLPRRAEKKELAALWRSFLADPKVQRALRRVIFKATKWVIGSNDDVDRESVFNALGNFIPTDLRRELLATVWAPNPTRAEQRKILAQVARLKREKLPGWKPPARALLGSAGAPAGRKEMADRRRLSYRWAPRRTGSYCDAEVATFLTVARRVGGYRKYRVSERSLTTDRHRHPPPRQRTRKVSPAELNKLFD